VSFKLKGRVGIIKGLNFWVHNSKCFNIDRCSIFRDGDLWDQIFHVRVKELQRETGLHGHICVLYAVSRRLFGSSVFYQEVFSAICLLIWKQHWLSLSSWSYNSYFRSSNLFSWKVFCECCNMTQKHRDASLFVSHFSVFTALQVRVCVCVCVCFVFLNY